LLFTIVGIGVGVKQSRVCRLERLLAALHKSTGR